MMADSIDQLVLDLLAVLGAGLASGLVCKRFGFSPLVGYLLVGGLIGGGGLSLVTQSGNELELLAEIGVLFLLFSVGIEFPPAEFARMGRGILIGGTLQMTLVAVPLIVSCWLFGMSWKGALLAGTAGALSSTVLVFKALAENGQTATEHGRRALSVLLFQDAALVPMLMIVPMLTGRDGSLGPLDFLFLGGKALAFLALVALVRFVVSRWFVPWLADLRSVELVLLFAVTLLGGIGLASTKLGLSPAIGAFATGLILSGQRLSKPIDTILLPFREVFSAVFFVSLGMLLRPLAFIEGPFLLIAGVAGMIALKALAACVALRVIGLGWRPALGMGLGLAQLGEFSFLLVSDGVAAGLVSANDYNRMLFVALGTLILTPPAIRLGLRWAETPGQETAATIGPSPSPLRRALVIGVGPVGRRVATTLETLGVEVCPIDLSPVNLYVFAQQGFATIVGDAREPEVLARAGGRSCGLLVVCVPDDDVAKQVVRTSRVECPGAKIAVRCRFESQVSPLLAAGATAVVSEEAEASGRLSRICESLIGPAETPKADHCFTMPSESKSDLT